MTATALQTDEQAPVSLAQFALYFLKLGCVGFGGPIALVKNGDMIELDVAARRLHLDVPETELATRRSAWKPPQPPSERGYYQLYHQHVLQADRGADLDFLVGKSGAEIPKECH